MIDRGAVADTEIDESAWVGSGPPLMSMKSATRGRTEIAWRCILLTDTGSRVVEQLLSRLRSSEKQAEGLLGQRYDALIYTEWKGADNYSGVAGLELQRPRTSEIDNTRGFATVCLKQHLPLL